MDVEKRLGKVMILQIDEQTAQAYFERLDAVRESVSRLPERFREDVLVKDNLANLEIDFMLSEESFK